MNSESLILLILCLLVPNFGLENDSTHVISKRFVLFPRYSILQITGGLSVPAIFPKKSINLSMGFQTNHEFPYNLSNFHLLYGRENSEDIDFDRKTMYEYVVNVVDAFGLDGETCLLRAICEVSDVPLHIKNGDDGDHLLEQILHYLLTPSKDFKDHKIHINTSLEHKTLVAERLGRIHGECYKIFRCALSLLDLFTNKYF